MSVERNDRVFVLPLMFFHSILGEKRGENVARANSCWLSQDEAEEMAKQEIRGIQSPCELSSASRLDDPLYLSFFLFLLLSLLFSAHAVGQVLTTFPSSLMNIE